MVEVKNPIGQTLLRVEENKILNLTGQVIATLEAGCLLNLQGQQLATATEDGFEINGRADFRLDGDSLIGPSGSVLATVSNGNSVERALAGAAYVEFILDA